MTTSICNHGFWISHCALCQKNPGECDYGNCQDIGTELVTYHGPVSATEKRRARNACAQDGKPERLFQSLHNRSHELREDHRMTDHTITCGCSYEFGPCENHADYLVIREGASLHTADELSLLLADDLRDCGVVFSDDQTRRYDELSKRLSAAENPTSGCAWFAEDDDAQAAHELAYELEIQADGLWMLSDDGYVIVRPHADCPLLDN